MEHAEPGQTTPNSLTGGPKEGKEPHYGVKGPHWRWKAYMLV